MKKIIVLSILFTACLQVNSQSLTIENLQPFVSGLYDLGEAYAFTEYGKKDQEKNKPFRIKVYDRQLANDVNVEIVVPNSYDDRALAYNGESFLTIFEDVKEKQYVYYTHDKHGNELGKKMIPKNKTNESVPVIKYVDGSGFYMFRTVKGEKWGYEVQRIDNRLNTVWTYEYIPEKSYVDFISPYVNENGLVLLEIVPSQKTQVSVGRIGKIDKDFYNLVILDKETGTLAGKYNLVQSGYFLEPTSLAIDRDGSVVLGGMYFNTAGKNNDNSDGTYIAKVAKDGKAAFVNKLAWADEPNNLQAFLTASNKKKKKGATFTPKVMYHQVSIKDGKYYLIGEVFQKAVSCLGMAAKLASRLENDGTSASSITFNILDFLVLTFDETGQLTNKAKASKPIRRVVQNDNSIWLGGMTKAGGLDFDFQFMTREGTQELGVVFRGTETVKFVEKEYFGYFSLDHSGETIEVKRIPFQMSGKTFDGDYKLAIYPHSSNKVLKYEYYADKVRLFLGVLEF